MDRKTMELHDGIMYSSLAQLNEFDVTSEEFTKGVNNLKTLNEIKKSDAEWKCQDMRRVDEQALKDEQAQTDKKFKIVENIIQVAGIVLPMIFYSRMTRMHMKFEKDGYIPRNSMFKNLTNKLHPTRRL